MTNKGLAFIYINGVNSGAVNFSVTDNFMSSRQLSFAGTAQAGIILRSIRFYNAALTDEQMLNNFNLYRRTVDEMMEVYSRNDIYEEGSENFSMDKLANQLPVMIITGDIPALEETTDKNKSIVVDIEYVNYQNPELSFTMKNAHMQPQGTSSMGYPKKNFRIYTQKRDDTRVYDYEGKEIASRLYSFKEGATPVNCWCLKADYAESSSTHNTAIARLWNDALKNMKVDDEYVCRTQAQHIAINGGYPYDVRTTVDGFPIVMAYRRTPTSDLVFIGKYNFNNDKETESVFGFKDIPGFDNSRMQCWEVLNNGNHLALFQDTDNFDSEWTDAFESRYPDTKTPNTADLKAFAKWITTTGNFASEKWQHLDVYKMAAYYVYVMRFGAVDQMVKNAMFTSEDGQKFYYINYDNDTINGLRNDGYLVYPPTITRQSLDESYTTEVYAYAGHDSRLWNYLETDSEFMRIVQVVDAALYNAGLTYANVIRMFDEQQSAKWCERVYNRDAQYKYVSPFIESGTNNLFMMQGSRQSHRRWWLSKRFSFIDSLFVSGEYKSNVVELKLANAPIGIGFGIKAGVSGNYGYGVNNVAISYGIALEQGEEHTFRTAQVLNIGDPLRIYAAPNLETVDLSNFIQYLSTLNIGGVSTETLGTKLKSLKLGVDSSADQRRNTALKEISGLGSAARLESLDIEGFQGITSLDFNSLKFLKTLKAKASGLTSVSLPDGSPVERLELPPTIQGIVLSNANNLTYGNLDIDGGWINVSSISIKRCSRLTDNWEFIHDWYMNKSTQDSKCSLVMEDISWGGVSAGDIIALGNIKTAGGNLSLKGTVRMISVNSEQIMAIKAIYGEHVFVKGGELWFTAPDGIHITGDSEVIEGDTIQLGVEIVRETAGETVWSIISGSGATVSQDGLVSTSEEGESRDIVVQVKHIPFAGSIVYNSKTIHVKKAVRPESGEISGNNAFNSEAEYSLFLSPEGINRKYSVLWSISGAASEGVVIKNSNKNNCVLSALPGTIGDLTVTATVVTDKGGRIVVEKKVSVGSTLKITILSNQDEDDTLNSVNATVSYDGKSFEVKNGSTITVPIYTVISISYPDFDGYRTPDGVEYVSGENEYEAVATYRTTLLTVIMSDNQPNYNDIADTKAIVSALGMSAKMLSSGESAKVPTGNVCTIEWSSVSGYRTPNVETFTTSGISMTKTGQYETEILTVNVVTPSDFDKSYTITVSGFGSHTTASKTYKIPFGTSYTVSASDVRGFSTPFLQSFTANSVSRTVTMEYVPKVTDLSMQDIFGNPISQTTANCYVVSEAGWYMFPLVFGNAIKDGVVNSAAYTNNGGSYSLDFKDFYGRSVTTPYIENNNNETASSAQLSIADTDGIFTDISIIDGSPCRYIKFKVNSIPAVGANGVISAIYGSSTVMWSWHIWVWSDDLTPIEIENATGVKYRIMPVNLASIWESSQKQNLTNWVYQFARPTPILGAKYSTGYNNDPLPSYGALAFKTIPDVSYFYYGLRYPTQFIKVESNGFGWFTTDKTKGYNLWDASRTSTGISDNNVVKTIYDPCPVGFKMPNGSEFSGFTKDNRISSSDPIFVYKRNPNDTTGIRFDRARSRNYQTGDIEKSGEIWYSAIRNDAYLYGFDVYNGDVSDYKMESTGLAVRPVKE